VLPGHDVGPRGGLERRAVERRGDRRDARVGAARVAADVDDAVARRAVDPHHARRGELGGDPHVHRRDAREPAQRRALVRDPVLCAHDLDRRRRAGGERVERRHRVLRLHREDHHLVAGPRQLARVLDDRRPRGRRPGGRDDREAAVAQRGSVGAPRDQHDVGAAGGEPAADRAADRAGAVDHEARCHRPPG